MTHVPALSPSDMDMLAQVPFFSHIPVELRQMLVRDAIVKIYDRPGLLFSHDDPADNIYVLLEGMVTISIYHEDGTQAVIETITPARTFAEATAFLQGYYPATAEYIAGSKLVVLPSKSFLARLEQSPETAFAILGSLALWERDLSSQLDTLKLNTASQRLIIYLLKQIPDDVGGTHSLTLPMGKTILAKKLGIKPESLSRLLARLAELGVTSERKTVTIANVDMLRAHINDVFDVK